MHLLHRGHAFHCSPYNHDVDCVYVQIVTFVFKRRKVYPIFKGKWVRLAHSFIINSTFTSYQWFYTFMNKN